MHGDVLCCDYQQSFSGSTAFERFPFERYVACRSRSVSTKNGYDYCKILPSKVTLFIFNGINHFLFASFSIYKQIDYLKNVDSGIDFNNKLIDDPGVANITAPARTLCIRCRLLAPFCRLGK